VISYASRTGTRRTLDALRLAGWRLLISAGGRPSRQHRTEGFRYALDNGAWSAYQRGQPFDAGAFAGLVELLGPGADWIVVPDVVADGRASLELSAAWLPRLEGFPLLVAVQDGMQPADVSAWLGPRVGIFLGGSTEWKLTSMRLWGELARARGAHFHVGRVNTERRISRCLEAGADSIDGTAVTRFHTPLGRLDRARRQGAFRW
jgi:hypothetical protein